MKYFKTTLRSRYDKMETIKLLKSMINTSGYNFFIFPFCLFSRSYYTYLKELKSKPFTGKVANNDFEFFKTFHYGVTSGTSRNIKILGSILEHDDGVYLELEFHSSPWEIVLEYVISIGCLIAFIVKKELLFLLIPAFLVLEKLRITMICYRIIKLKN